MSTRTRAAVAAGAATLSLTGLTGCDFIAQHTPLPTLEPTTAGAPAETTQERTMRLDKEAAEKAYALVSKESNRLGMAGGASKPTKILTDNADGIYLEVQMNDLSFLKSNGYRADMGAKTIVTANGGWSAKKIGLTACEDASKLRLLNKSGKEVEKDRPKRFVQTLTATRVDGRWKITGVDSKIVKTFRTESGCSNL